MPLGSLVQVDMQERRLNEGGQYHQGHRDGTSPPHRIFAYITKPGGNPGRAGLWGPGWAVSPGGRFSHSGVELLVAPPQN